MSAQKKTFYTQVSPAVIIPLTAIRVFRGSRELASSVGTCVILSNDNNSAPTGEYKAFTVKKLLKLKSTASETNPMDSADFLNWIDRN